MSSARSASAATSLPNIGALTPAATGRSTAAVGSGLGDLRAVAPSRREVVICWAFLRDEFGGTDPSRSRGRAQPGEQPDAGITVSGFDPELALVVAHGLHGGAADAAVDAASVEA